MYDKNSSSYVNNEELYQELCVYMEKLKSKPGLRIPESIGKKIYTIANGLSYKANFINYPYIEDMRFDAILDCLKYIKNYNVEKNNPHAYFTTICINAFLRRIAKEKKLLYTKFKIQINNGNEMNIEGASDGSVAEISKGTVGDFSRIHQFVSEYENSKNFGK